MVIYLAVILDPVNSWRLKQSSRLIIVRRIARLTPPELSYGSSSAN